MDLEDWFRIVGVEQAEALGGRERLEREGSLLTPLTRAAFEEALSWLDLAAGAADDRTQTDAVNRRTADLLEAAGWSAAPARRPSPITREIVTEDLYLPVRQP